MTPRDALEDLLSLATEQGSFSEPDGADVLRALLRRDWAVRVLDAQVKAMGAWHSWETTCGVTLVGTEQWTVSFTNPDRDQVDGPWDGVAGKTPDEARLAAADEAYTLLSDKDQAELGECP